MQPISRAFAITAIAFLLAGCAVPKPDESNPGFDEIDQYMIDHGLANNTTANPYEPRLDNESGIAEPAPEERKGWWDWTKSIFKTIVQLLDKVVKTLFGEKAWYFIGAAVVLIIAFKILGAIGMIIMFLILMYIFITVVK